MNSRSPSGKVSDSALNTAVATGSPPSHAAPRADSVRKWMSRGMTAMSDGVCIRKSGLASIQKPPSLTVVPAARKLKYAARRSVVRAR